MQVVTTVDNCGVKDVQLPENKQAVLRKTLGPRLENKLLTNFPTNGLRNCLFCLSFLICCSLFKPQLSVIVYTSTGRSSGFYRYDCSLHFRRKINVSEKLTKIKTFILCVVTIGRQCDVGIYSLFCSKFIMVTRDCTPLQFSREIKYR